MDKPSRDDIIVMAAPLVVAVVVLSALIFYYIEKQQTKIEKNCSEEHTTFTSEVFKCPDGKSYVHLHVLDRSANAMCCEKE